MEAYEYILSHVMPARLFWYKYDIPAAVGVYTYSRLLGAASGRDMQIPSF